MLFYDYAIKTIFKYFGSYNMLLEGLVIDYGKVVAYFVSCSQVTVSRF